ncbi:MAG: flagellar export protein FliJ [Halieaceae bacterium]
MIRSKRLERVTDIRREQERKAGSQLADAQQAHASKEQMLQQLLQYRQEYQALFAEQSTQGLDAQQYRNFQQFFAQLDRAVEEQRHTLELGETEVEQTRDQWIEKRQASETLSRLTAMALETEQQELQKQEQKQADELHGRRSRQ